MKPLILIAVTATLAAGESHPSWWTYAPPEATALVGIQWNNLRHSPFASAIEAEFSPDGALGFPDLDCLRQAREIIISAPPLLAAEAGSFPSATVTEQAQRHGLHRLAYHGVTLWLPATAGKVGVAQVSEQVLLLGDQAALQAAIDRTLPGAARTYSTLLPKAARFAQTGDLWVVALKLPDPLASLFVPLENNATEFLGQVSVRDGLSVEASFDAGSEAGAAAAAKELRERAPFLPAVARGLQSATEHNRVTISLLVRSEDLVAALHSAPQIAEPVARLSEPSARPVALQTTALSKPQPSPATQPTAAPVQIAAGTPQPTLSEPVKLETVKSEPVKSEEAAPEAVKFELVHVEGPPQVIRIYGLDEGVREIVVPGLPTHP